MGGMSYNPSAGFGSSGSQQGQFNQAGPVSPSQLGANYLAYMASPQYAADEQAIMNNIYNQIDNSMQSQNGFNLNPATNARNRLIDKQMAPINNATRQQFDALNSRNIMGQQLAASQALINFGMANPGLRVNPQQAMPPNVSIGFGPAPVQQAPAPMAPAPVQAPKPSPFAAVTTTAPKAAPAPAPVPKTAIKNQLTRTRIR